MIAGEFREFIWGVIAGGFREFIWGESRGVQGVYLESDWGFREFIWGDNLPLLSPP